jgi:hypothetical protein
MVNNRFFLLVIGMLLLVSCVQAAPVTSGLVAYYDGNLSGHSLADLSGNNNIGYATNAAQGTDPRTDANYINLNGINSKIDISSNTQTNISSPMSIEFIGSINTFSRYGALVSKYNNGSLGWYLSCSPTAPYNNARFCAATQNGLLNGYNSNIVLVAGQTYDIVATYDNNVAHIYVNGVDSSDARSWNSPIAGSASNITMGSGSGLNYSNCSMYTFRLYNRSLSSAEVLQNYNNDLWRYVPQASGDDITMIKKRVYGDGGLPRYMGSYAIQKSNYGLNVLDDNLDIYSSTGTPFFQNNNSSLTNCSLVESTINGIRWRNCYAPGSSAVLTYTGENRSVLETCLLSNDSFNLNHSVTYSGQTQTIQDGVPVNGGSAYEFYGDGLNKISGNDVLLYTDNAEVQCNVLYNSTGKEVYSYYQTRNAGVTRTSSLDLPLSSPQLTPMPVPSGCLGALIFAEHADYTDHDSLRTVMYGTNDTNNSIYGTKGFIGHNLTATWSVFAVSSFGGEGLDSPELKSITDDMYKHGFEITPHTFNARVDEGLPNRADAETYLPWYTTNYSCQNWIDHGLASGARNSELKSCGWDPASEYYIMDLFQDYKVPYAWAFVDVTPEGKPSTSKISSVGLPVDIVWQNTNLALPEGTPIYQWKSCATGKGIALIYYTNSTIDGMLSTYGVSIWHDYWPDNSSPYLKNYYYVQGQPNMINETFDGLLSNISAQKQAGKLWNPTVSEYIDYWIDASNVEVRCTGVNTYTVVNHNPGTVNGFSMRVEGVYTPKLDGVTLSTKPNGVDTIFWMDLPTGTHVITLEA